MAENTEPQGDNETTATGDVGMIDESKDSGQSGIDWKAAARKWEARAKESHATAKANEGAARRLAEIEEAQKTEAEKAAERLAAAEQRAAELEVKAARAEVAADKGVPADLLQGTTVDELAASADALIKFRAEAVSPGNFAPLVGTGSPAVGGSNADKFARFIESRIT